MSKPFDRIIGLDFESSWGRKVGLGFSCQTMEEYLRDPRFKAWGLSWAYIEEDGSHHEVWVRHSGLPAFFASIDWTRTAVVAQNASFDVSIMAWHYGVHPAFVFDTLSMGRALHGVEAGNSLKTLAERYGLPPKGNGLESSENYLDELPFKVEEELAVYCRHDTWLAIELMKFMLPEFPTPELRLIDMTMRMYTQPRLVLDQKLLTEALEDEKEELAGALAKVKRTESELASNDIFADVLKKLGVEVPMKPSPRTPGKMICAFAKNDALFQQLVNGEREDVALLCAARLRVKSTQARTRAQRFIDIAGRGPLPVPLNYWGAGPGRWQASKGSNINLQNMKRGSRLRKAIMAQLGYQCIVGDLSQIEPRILAYISDYHDLLAIFRAGGDPYAVFGSTMFGVPGMTKETHPVLRQSAKSALLGAGYMLGWPSFAAQLLVGFLGAPPKQYMMADAKLMGISRDQLARFYGDKWSNERMAEIAHVCTYDELVVHCCVAKEIITRYRNAAEPVVEFWGLMGKMIERCIFGGDTVTHKCLTFGREAVLMPNGMSIRYPGIEQFKDERGRIQYRYTKGKKVERLHPGTLTNNVTQGLARIVMSDGMLRVQTRLPVVMTVHDELIAIVSDADAERAKPWVLRQMIKEPPYLPGIPLAAEGGMHQRYGVAKE